MSTSENYDIDEVYAYEINGIPLETGDIICTIDGNPSFLIGQFWWIVGKLIPGTVDHIAVYVGPEGRCVEAGAKGREITFEVRENLWDALKMFEDRYIMDKLHGVAYPLARRDLRPEQIRPIRLDVGRYCLQQAKEKKPYNLNFFDSDTEDRFYCSQLAYKAYIRHGINLNTERDIPNIPFSETIVFPHEVWAACNEKEIYVG